MRPASLATKFPGPRNISGPPPRILPHASRLTMKNSKRGYELKDSGAALRAIAEALWRVGDLGPAGINSARAIARTSRAGRELPGGREGMLPRSKFRRRRRE